MKRVVITVLFVCVLLLGVLTTPLAADPHGRLGPTTATISVSEHPFGGDQMPTSSTGDVPDVSWNVLLFMINLPGLI